MTYRKEHPMKMTGSWIVVACAALICGCAATVPSELVDARLAYQHASAGAATQLVPADLHTAQVALARAEEAFAKDSKSYHTRDLAYVAQRKAEMADVLASIAVAQKTKIGSDKAYEVTQENLLEAKKQDLDQTHDQLAAEQTARVAAEQNEAAALAALAKLAAVKEEERGLVITLSGSVLFRSGESTLMPGAQTRLDQVADALLASGGRNVVVEGFTDSQGSDQYNLDLSQRRAEAVRDYIVQRGYDGARIQARGIGEDRPIADNTTAEGRANNRRVELVLAPVDKL
jgi:outer membrane protein OmpA-like peptidoglycan-associated protein